MTDNDIQNEPAPDLLVQADSSQPPKQGNIKRFLLDVVETLLLSALLFMGINAITARIRVDGLSMHPTLETGEFVLVNRLAYQIGEPRIGDIVVFHFPGDPEQEYIKRVIGLPGDDVRVYDQKVSVNGRILIEPYISEAPHYQTKWTVPPDSIFVLGDNRNNSSDSHNWGPVPLDNVIGKAIFIYWPIEHINLVTHSSPEMSLP